MLMNVLGVEPAVCELRDWEGRAGDEGGGWGGSTLLRRQTLPRVP